MGEGYHDRLGERVGSSSRRVEEAEGGWGVGGVQELKRDGEEEGGVSDEEGGDGEGSDEQSSRRDMNRNDWPLRRDVSPVGELEDEDGGGGREGSGDHTADHRHGQTEVGGPDAGMESSWVTECQGASRVSSSKGIPRSRGPSEEESWPESGRHPPSLIAEHEGGGSGVGQPSNDSNPVSPVHEQGKQHFDTESSREGKVDSVALRRGDGCQPQATALPSDTQAKYTQPIPELSEDDEAITHDAPSPIVNGSTAPTTTYGRSSSIMKSPPPSRNMSRRSSQSTYNTTQITENKDRVRYSWQSIQDDEPNRPRIHIIKLVSNTATASAGFPQGEAFGFSISSAGRKIAAYNSARLFVLQTAALPVGISQDYALKRRPLAVEILDDGSVLAVLADEHTVNLYDLSQQQLQRMRTIKLDFPTNCIALAPAGGLLAAAYEGGVEVFSLDPNALATDRRAVRSQRMDKLAFSEDGSTLLGTTTRVNVSSTVVVSVPVFPSNGNGIPTSEELKEAWCSELLHPENIRNSSHATFMRENRACCNERLYAWNGGRDTFGILNTIDMEYSNVDFPIVISPPLSTCGGLGAAIHSCPTVDEHGDTVAMIVNDRTIRLYVVPHKVEDNEMHVEAHSIDHELDEGYGCPFNEVRWVHSQASLPAPLSNQTQIQGRLMVTSPGGVMDPSLPEESVQDLEGGRIILFDFDPQFAGQPGQTFSLTLGKSPPQTLGEEEFDVAQQVELVRRRTVNQSKSGGLSQKPVTLGRAASTFNSGRSSRALNPSAAMTTGPPSASANRRSVLSIHSMQSEATKSLPDLVEGAEAIEEPYANQAPRSQASLQRAATNAQRHRFQTIEERNQERVSVDSNSTFLPLPQYTEEPNAPLPGRYRAMAGLDNPGRFHARPAVQTNAGLTPPQALPSGLMTAPASVGETFSAEQAFAVASETSTMLAANSQRSQPLPRSLQRAYNTAMNPTLGTGPAPSLIGDWENVSPVGPNGTGRPYPGLQPPPPREEDPDAILPVAPPGQTSSPIGRPQESYNRYSPSLLSSVGNPNRASSSASSFGGGSVSQQQHLPRTNLPPHMQAFRAAAASASLFPPSAQSDRVPHRQQEYQHPGGVAHPITAWHPPSSSVSSTVPPGSSAGRSHHSTVGSAVTGAEKGKKTNWFGSKRGKKTGEQPYEDGSGAARSPNDGMAGDMNWGQQDRKCVMM